VLVGGSTPVTLDEVQREPELLRAVKRAIDRDRKPGRFLLTGSANLLLMRQVSESLAGRASYLTLWPMTRREQRGLGRVDAGKSCSPRPTPNGASYWPMKRKALRIGICWLAAADFRHQRWNSRRLPIDASGSMDMSARTSSAICSTSPLSALCPIFRRLMRAACRRIGQLVNQTELGRDVTLPQPTVHRWLNLLETSYLLVRLPAYAVNRTKRLIKAPKIYWGDTGVAMQLAETEEPGGAHMENLVLHDLLAWRDARIEHAELGYWRTSIGEEVDFVIEAGGKLLPIEVKSTARPRIGDAAHLRTFHADYGKKARAGLLLHTGDAIEWLAPDVLAAPWWRVL
jgi:uncharacterized protein